MSNCLIFAYLLAATVPGVSGQQSMLSAGAELATKGASARSPLAFAIVSVKQDKTDQPLNIGDPSDGNGLTIRNMSLEQIVEFAFDIHDSELLEGLPGWAKTTKYDLQAKVDDSDLNSYHSFSKDQHAAMLQTILADRFKIVVHNTLKDTGVYSLVIAKSGLKMREAKPGQVRTDGVKQLDGTVNQGPLMLSRVPGQILGQELPVDVLAKGITPIVGRKIINNTGFKGVYDFRLEWDPNRGREDPEASPTETSGLSIFTALQEQLGLKLEGQKVSVPVLVIDHIEHPSEN